MKNAETVVVHGQAAVPATCVHACRLVFAYLQDLFLQPNNTLGVGGNSEARFGLHNFGALQFMPSPRMLTSSAGMRWRWDSTRPQFLCVCASPSGLQPGAMFHPRDEPYIVRYIPQGVFFDHRGFVWRAAMPIQYRDSNRIDDHNAYDPYIPNWGGKD